MPRAPARKSIWNLLFRWFNSIIAHAGLPCQSSISGSSGCSALLLAGCSQPKAEGTRHFCGVHPVKLEKRRCLTILCNIVWRPRAAKIRRHSTSLNKSAAHLGLIADILIAVTQNRQAV
jgi:hypothetical protein